MIPVKARVKRGTLGLWWWCCAADCQYTDARLTYAEAINAASEHVRVWHRTQDLPGKAPSGPVDATNAPAGIRSHDDRGGAA